MSSTRLKISVSGQCFLPCLLTVTNVKNGNFARIGSTIGANIVGVAIMPIVLFFSMTNSSGSGDKSGWFWFAFIVALIGVITSIAVGIGTREVESKLRDNNEKLALNKSLKFLVKTTN